MTAVHFRDPLIVWFIIIVLQGLASMGNWPVINWENKEKGKKEKLSKKNGAMVVYSCWPTVGDSQHAIYFFNFQKTLNHHVRVAIFLKIFVSPTQKIPPNENSSFFFFFFFSCLFWTRQES